MKRRDAPALAALAGILVITAAWWALALWPLPAGVPAWLEQTRLVCFGSRQDALPTAAGWMLLIGEPLAMLALLRALAPGAFASRVARATLLLALLVAASAATLRVRMLRGEPFDPVAGDPPPMRLGREAPPLELVDQHGRPFGLREVRGRATLVVFAYAHCATVCPLLVHDAIEARRAVAGSALLIVTLDPWRDTPSRLPAIAAQWQLDSATRVLSGPPGEVERVLDAWEIARRRDPATGEITHPAFVYVVDGAGRLAWQATGRAATIIPLLAAAP